MPRQSSIAVLHFSSNRTPLRINDTKDQRPEPDINVFCVMIRHQEKKSCPQNYDMMDNFNESKTKIKVISSCRIYFSYHISLKKKIKMQFG